MVFEWPEKGRNRKETGFLRETRFLAVKLERGDCGPFALAAPPPDEMPALFPSRTAYRDFVEGEQAESIISRMAFE